MKLVWVTTYLLLAGCAVHPKPPPWVPPSYQPQPSYPPTYQPEPSYYSPEPPEQNFTPLSKLSEPEIVAPQHPGPPTSLLPSSPAPSPPVQPAPPPEEQIGPPQPKGEPEWKNPPLLE
jgi:hypothetical protein